MCWKSKLTMDVDFPINKSLIVELTKQYEPSQYGINMLLCIQNMQRVKLYLLSDVLCTYEYVHRV